MKNEKIIDQLKKKNAPNVFIDLITSTEADVITRPGIYQGTHFFAYDTTLLWSTTNDGSACGIEKWFIETKQEGDTYKKIGICENSGMEKYEIKLV